MQNTILVTEVDFEEATAAYREACKTYRSQKAKAEGLTRMNGSLIPGYWEACEVADEAKAKRDELGQELVKLVPVW